MRKNLAVGLVITTVMTALSVAVADDGNAVSHRLAPGRRWPTGAQ